MTEGPGKLPAAEQRTLELMKKGPRAALHRAKGGYLDLLEAPPPAGSFAGRLMRTRFVPMIYERWWRPVLSQLVKGVSGPRMSQEAAIATDLLRLGRGGLVLDVACGPGNFSREFARTVGRDGLVVGIDASETMLARGVRDLKRSRRRNLALIRADATAMPFKAGHFDAVCCFGALHLFDDPFTALDEFARVLAPGGRVAVMTSARRGITPAFTKPAISRAVGMRIFDQREITGALADRGFGDLESEVYGMVQFTGGRLK